jgi:hypothetical protein
LYVSFFITSSSLLFMYSINHEKLIRSLKADLDSADTRIDLNPTYLPLFICISSFGLVNQQINFIYHEGYSFSPTCDLIISENLDFMFFAFDSFIRAACLDLFESYDIHISRISPNGFWISSFTFLFKTFMAFFALSFLKAIYSSLTKLGHGQFNNNNEPGGVS